MAKGKARSFLLGIQGLIGHKTAPDWGFIYEASLVRNPKFNIGDRVVLPDGREFRYGKSAGECVSGLGCRFMAAGYVSYTVFAVDAAIEDKEITVPAATHAALDKDELRGGYIVIYDPAGSEQVQFRGIIGNDASILNVAFKVYLDGPLTVAVTTSSAIEVFQNPYASLLTAGTVNKAVAGIPAVQVSASDTYFWVQKSGPVWASPRGGVNDRDQGCYWTHEGQIKDTEASLNAITLPATNTSQYAGHTILGNEDNIGPLFMLQG